MSMFKIAMATAATLGVVLAGTAANAEQVRAAAATPGVVSVKKIKILRTVAPATRASHEVDGTDVALTVAAAAGAGGALYLVTRNDSNGG
jgi:hypothetical protein